MASGGPNASDTPLFKGLWNSRIESPPREDRFFIPNSKLDDLLVPENIEKELLLRAIPARKISKAKLPNYVTKIFGTAKLLFATLVLAERSFDIHLFIDEGIGDKDLPFVREPPESCNSYKLCLQKHVSCQKEGLTQCACEIRAMSDWDCPTASKLYTSQWQVMAPVFQKVPNSVPNIYFHDSVVLPFEENHKAHKRSGGYAHVWAVRIHSMHQNLVDKPGPLLALKCLKSGDEEPFLQEFNMLRRLEARKDQHIIQLLAAFRHRKEYYMLFPFADKNLRGYWMEAARSPPAERSIYLWSLRQIKGLTAALSLIHNFNFEFDDKTKAQIQYSGHHLNVTISEPEFGRHGDITPENILWFSGTKPILQLADLGLGRFHREVSRSHVGKVAGSETYAPPEIVLRRHVSRAYDIWSFGCVLLEFISWMIKGGGSIPDFADERAEGDGPISDDLFYSLTYTHYEGQRFPVGATLRGGVVQWIEALKREPRCSDVLRDLLVLVQNQMLKIDASDRITSQKLNSKLEKLLEKAENDTAYAESGINASWFSPTRMIASSQEGLGIQDGHVAEAHL